MNMLKYMTRDELRKLAKELNIAGRGTMLKPELVAAIMAARDESAQVTALNAQEDERRLTPPRGRMSVTGGGKSETMIMPVEANTTYLVGAPASKKTTRKMRERAGRRGERGMVNGQVMELHHMGRAMGAKHYTTPRLVMAAFTPPLGASNATPLSRAQRVVRYMAQNGSHSKALTPKQRRRMARKYNHNVLAFRAAVSAQISLYAQAGA